MLIYLMLALSVLHRRSPGLSGDTTTGRRETSTQKTTFRMYQRSCWLPWRQHWWRGLQTRGWLNSFWFSSSPRLSLQEHNQQRRRTNPANLDDWSWAVLTPSVSTEVRISTLVRLVIHQIMYQTMIIFYKTFCGCWAVLIMSLKVAKQIFFFFPHR